LPALKKQKEKLKKQLAKERQECLELEMNVESMSIEINQPPAIGKSRLVCGHCHHRGHRNSGSKPCEHKTCTDFTYCGIKEKHPEYFSKLSSLKMELKKKKTSLHEIEAQITSMEDFTTGSEFAFVKNLTPRMFAADPSYKVNKAKLMRDVRLLRTFLDGKIPAVTVNDKEQLRILISKCKKETGISADSKVGEIYTCGSLDDVSPIKVEVEYSTTVSTETRQAGRVDNNADIFDYRSKKHKSKKHKKTKKAKKRSRAQSSSSSEDDTRSRHDIKYSQGAGNFPYFTGNASYDFPIQPPYRNPYFYSPPYGPFTAQNPNIAFSNSVDNHHLISNSVNSFNAAPFCEPDPGVRLVTDLPQPESTENVSSRNNELGLWRNLDALAHAAIERNIQNN
jgi:hypothetical protein